MKVTRRRNGLLILACIASLSAVGAKKSHAALVAEDLGWIWAPSPLNFCPGHFQQPLEISSVKNPGPLSQSVTTIHAESRVDFSSSGTSTLNGPVTITQPGRKLRADKVVLKRNPKTEAVNEIDMQGRVSFWESDKMLISDQATINLESNCTKMTNAAYRTNHILYHETLTGWGTASTAYHQGNNTITLFDSTYTTCGPNRCVWQLRAKSICLDQEKGQGVARHMQLRLAGLPVLYTPYFSFPLGKQRKSGLLTPSFGYSHDNGAEIEIPYYLNLAPNYDTIVTGKLMTSRGIQIKTASRYLTQQANGRFEIELLPQDSEFERFKESAPEKIGTDPTRLPFLSRIENASINRYRLAGDNFYQLNSHFGGSLNFNYVSDDYYFQDFGNNPIANNTDQLLNQFNLHYDDSHWSAIGQIQAYQTLHPLGLISPEPYNRVPELFVHGFYPKQLGLFDLEMTGDYNYFDHRHFFVTNTSVITGGRLHLQPAIHLPLENSAAYLTPSLRLDITEYWLNPATEEEPEDLHRSLPIFNIDSGLFLEREMVFHHCNYRQTLEPRAYYLYVPEINQHDIPLFDTSLPNFNYEQMFYYNRFAGFDRISDANQMAMAVTSRLLTEADGTQLVAASVGTIYYFQHPHVGLNSLIELESQDIHSHFSPIIGLLDIYLMPRMGATGVWAWNPRDNRTDNALVSLHYGDLHEQIINLEYEFVRDGDIISGESSQDLSRLNLSVSLPYHHWHLWADWNYNLSHAHPQSYFVGFGYESCCWGIRAIASATVLDANLQDNHKYDNKFYVQVKLKGLGMVGNNDPSRLLESGINGYVDRFNR